MVPLSASSAEVPRDVIGTTLGHYRIVEKLGQGGMGEVYRADDTKLKRQVALKVLPSRLSSDPEGLARFQREAESVAALNHPHIVTIFSVEKDRDTHFLTMELVEGKSLDQLISEEGVGIDQAFDLSIPLTDALSAAHATGIVHRDLKPTNVMLTADGRVKILDFGLAKLVGEGSDVGSSPDAATEALTEVGTVMGTLPYMSPEQIEGLPVDHRTDVFSVGVMLYELLAGHRPFQAGTSAALTSAILRDAPPVVSELRQDLPHHFGRIVRRCLEKDPERRYQSAKDLRNDLLGLREELASGQLEPPQAGPTEGSEEPFWKRAAIVLGLVVAVGGGWTVMRGISQSGDVPPPSPEATMEIMELTSSGSAWEASLSPDGEYVAHEFSHDGLQSLRVTHVATGSHVDIFGPGEADIWDPIFAPDGDFIYFIEVASGDPFPSLYRVPVLGGTSRKVLDHVNERISFSPDGHRFVFARFDNQASSTAADARARESRLLVADLDGSNERVIATRQFPDFYGDPVWSPDGSLIAVNAFSFASGGRGTIVTLSPDGGPEAEILPGEWYDVGELAWLPDGNGLVFTAQDSPASKSQIWELSYPERTVRRITNDLGEYLAVSVNAGGTVAVAEKAENRFDLWLAAPGEGSQSTRLTSGGNVEGTNLSWTTDGRIIYESDAQGNSGVWSVSQDGGEPVRLTPRDQPSYSPSASSDGRTIVFVSDRAGAMNVWRMHGDGSNPVQLTQGSLEEAPEISRDGSQVVFVGGPNASLHRVPAEGGEAVEIYSLRSRQPRFSPDGSRVAVLAYHEDSGAWKLDVVSLATGELQHSSEAASANHGWTADGRGIEYVGRQDQKRNIYSQALKTGSEHQLTQFDDDEILAFAWSPDRQRLVVARGQTTRDVVLLKNFR